MFQPQPAPFSGPAIRSLQPRSALKILVTSRKGGVGKSTISANLAAYFKAELGLTTTLLDLDLHGSSSDWLRAAR
ncbi:MAG: P-loop NTPase, partial [Burkholderiaceae bacterium]|nr:P-loop NTPase [Burkholderiaceae bacterium]